MDWRVALGATLTAVLLVTGSARSQEPSAQAAFPFAPQDGDASGILPPTVPSPQTPMLDPSMGMMVGGSDPSAPSMADPFGDPMTGGMATPQAMATPQSNASALQELSETVESLSKRLTITTGDENFQVLFGGSIVADFVFSNARPVAPGTPFLLTPGSVFGFEQDSFSAHARQSSLFALVNGPQIGAFQSRGLFLANFFDVAVIRDQFGFLPLEAWVDLNNRDWRVAAGLQFDIFNPLTPTVLPFSLLSASGNTGNAYRGQARLVRYLYPSEDSQITIQTGLSEPVATFFSEEFLLSEDNGWPNIEARVAYGLGPPGEGLLAPRPLEFGVSGLIGQLRNTDVPAGVSVVADVWGIGADLRWAITERFGIKAEMALGQGLGTYGGGILSTVNPITFEGIRSAGGFGEVYYYWIPETLHTHIGYGIDDPVDADLAALQPLRNETYFANLLWDVTKAFRLGLEVSYRETSYSPALPDNDGVLIHTQVLYKF